MLFENRKKKQMLVNSRAWSRQLVFLSPMQIDENQILKVSELVGLGGIFLLLLLRMCDV